MPRGKRTSKNRSSFQEHSDDEDGVLYVGGVRLQMDNQGNLTNMSSKRSNRRQNKHNKQPSVPKKQYSSDSQGHTSDAPDSELADYLGNTAASSDDEDQQQQSPTHREHQARQELEMLKRFVGVEIGEEGHVEDIGWISNDNDDSASGSWTSGTDDSDEEDVLDGEFIMVEPNEADNNDQAAALEGVHRHEPTKEEIQKELDSVVTYMLSEEYRQLILATAEQEARLDVAAVDPEVYLMKKKKGKGREKKMRGMEGLDSATLTAVYERRAREKRLSARATRDQYVYLMAQAKGLDIDIYTQQPEVSGRVQTVLNLLEEHADRVEQWPVLLAATKPKTSSSTGAKGKKHRPGVKGAKGGKLAPGEKASLRKQKIEDKRAARAAGRGFDLASCNRELHEFVDLERDMMAFPPMGKHECRVVQKLAALYGCKATVQGSGKRRMVMITATARTEAPDELVLLEIGRMLAEHNASEFHGGVAMEQSGRGSSGKGRWAGFKQGSRDYSMHETNVRNAKTKYRQPVAFVSKGNMDPNQEDMEIIVTKPAGEEQDDDYEDDFVDDMVVVEQEQQQGDDDDELLPNYSHAGLGVSSKTVELLTVFEDRGGASEPYPLQPASNPISEGITNPSRLLGLGMALGVGPQVFEPTSTGLGFTGVDDDEDEDVDLSPLQRKLSKSELKRQKKKGKRAPSAMMQKSVATVDGHASTRTQYSGSTSGEFAQFEQYTTGIGSKLLSKWGFAGEGSGLGREGTGRSEPILPKKRGKGLGLGADMY